MSQSVAGVMLLAFGNGALDVASTIASAGQNRSSLVAGGLFEGTLYICTTVIGLPIALGDLPIPKSLLRGIAVTWNFAMGARFRRGYNKLQATLGFFVFYLACLAASNGEGKKISKRLTSIFRLLFR